MIQQQTLYIKPEDWQKVQLQGRIDQVAEQLQQEALDIACNTEWIWSEQWISLRQALPNPNEPVFWYDAGFDNIMYFALAAPGTQDADFTHFTRHIPTTRPQEYNEEFSDKQVGWYPSKTAVMEVYNNNANTHTY